MKSNVELFSYIDQNQLSKEFGGTLEYSHQDWVKFRLVSPLGVRMCYLPEKSKIQKYHNRICYAQINECRTFRASLVMRISDQLIHHNE